MSVYGARFQPERHDEYLRIYGHLLPELLVKKMLSFRQLRDAQLFMLGKIILLKGLQALGYSNVDLAQICYGRNNKPYITDGPSFNISHSGDYVVCAVSATHQVGIDIEQHSDINFQEMKCIWSAKEWNCIQGSENSLNTFFKLWTRKEAILKADGIGLTNNLKDLSVDGDIILFNNKAWHLNRLMFADDYEVHIATDKPLTEEIVFEFLLADRFSVSQ